ncbi:unnamed protein product [Chrysoparadoxa australica]
MGGGFEAAVHRCRFIEWMPDAIHAIAANERTVAVGRATGAIEIMVPSEDYRVERRVPGKTGQSLQALCWCHGRLLGCGLDGTVFEVDLERLELKNVRDSYGGAAWCMASHPVASTLAVGCEDGKAKLFSIEDGSLEFSKSLSSTNSRVLSIAWSADGSCLYLGGADSHVRCVRALDGASVYHIKLESYLHEPTLVWSLLALGRDTLVTGDSLGHMQFWDTASGSLLQSFNTHEADILSLAASSNGSSVYGSGVDNKVVPSLIHLSHYCTSSHTQSTLSQQRVPTIPSRAGKWAFSFSHRPHTHDVKALCTFTPR